MAPLYTPTSIEELAGWLARLQAQGQSVRVTSRPAVGETDAPVDFRLSLAGLPGAIEHAAGDLIATIPAGTTLRAANELLARGGQWLPLDPPDPDMTIGAIIATNASGPRRHQYGTPRDLIIGIEMALADGRTAKAGGRVVKNVAGYDLARLMCGSRGSLAVITSATFKLSPLSSASRTVVMHPANVAALVQLSQAVSSGSTTPSAVELDADPPRLLVRFETTTSAASTQAEAIAGLARQANVPVSVLSGHEESELWRQYEADGWQATGTLVQVSFLPSDTVRMLEAIVRTAAAENVHCRVAGRAALGILSARLSGGSEPQHVVVVETLRAIAGNSCTAVIARGHADATSRWGDIGDSAPLMRAVKARFDPRNTLNPGGGPGGL